MIDVPSINKGPYNKSGYSWNIFLSEFEVTLIELAYVCSRNGRKNYYIRVGKFTRNQFMIQGQLKGNGNTVQPWVGFGCHNQQKSLISSLAEVDVILSAPPPLTSSLNDRPMATTECAISIS